MANTPISEVILFGGTFDPWTPAHEEIALTLSERPNSRVLVIPSGITRHRTGKKPLFTHEQRLATILTRISELLLVARHPSSQIDAVSTEIDLFKNAPGRIDPDKYGFIDTVKTIIFNFIRYYHRFTDETKVKFVVGSDEWKDIHKWKDYEELLQIAEPIIVLRGDEEPPEGRECITLPKEFKNISATKIRQLIKKHMIPFPKYATSPRIWAERSGKPVKLLATPIFNVLSCPTPDPQFRAVQVKAPDWVTMIAKHGGNFVLVKQYRWGIDKDCVEFVTGQIDKGEEPKFAACRELKEETGWSVNLDNVEYLGSTYTNPAFMTNQMHYFFVDLDKHGIKSEQSLDEHEKIEVIEGTLPEEIPALMLAGVHLLERKINEQS